MWTRIQTQRPDKHLRLYAKIDSPNSYPRVSLAVRQTGDDLTIEAVRKEGPDSPWQSCALPWVLAPEIVDMLKVQLGTGVVW